MNKKVIGLIVVIGLVVVAVLAFSGQKKKAPANTPATYEDSNQTQSGSQSGSGAFTMNVRATPESIKSAGEEKDYNKVEKTVINIQYKNNTKEEIAGVKVYTSISGGKYEIAAFPTSPMNQEDTKASKSHVVFDGPSVKAGEVQSVLFYLFSREAKDLTVNAEIRHAGQTSKAPSLVLQVN